MKRIVIIGGGFAGVNFARGLAGKEGYQVTLVDRNNYNFFPPLLYQVATGFLAPSNISYPFRKLFRHAKNINFCMGELQQVKAEQMKVVLSSGELPYDYLVFAQGATTNYFGMENVRQNALPMKTLSDALALRNHLLRQVEQSVFTEDAKERQKLLNVVVVGSGPTGVEVSGMLADIRKHILPKDYPDIPGIRDKVNIYLVDGLDAVLKPMSPKSQQDSFDALKSMGVEIMLGRQVKDYADDVVTFTNGESITTKTLVWAAGVTGVTFDGIPPECYGRGKRLIVNQFNKVIGMEGTYALGDCCIQTTDLAFPNGHPQMAQPGIQQGINLAKNFLAVRDNQPLKEFSYHDKGSMAIIGRNKAVVDLPGNKMHFKGFIAWFMWLFIHLISLVSRRNRITTLYNWAGAYFSRDQSLRMILRPSRE
ncbi:MAG TPA: NAD(P)/FAD-dependent oxidoreductase [Chitinophagaceae bacterium]|jgi:NADH dehydrogenase